MGAVTGVALAVEGGLGLLALAAGFVLGHSPLSSLSWSLEAAWWGVVATLPMILGLVIVERAACRPLRRVRQVVARLVRELFAGASLTKLALISAAAGLGEEMLFRGLLQDGLARAIGGAAGVPIALLVARAAFGLAHPITPTYALLGALSGLYLGGLFLVTGNLLSPIVAPALYDLVALAHIVRSSGGPHEQSPAAPGGTI